MKTADHWAHAPEKPCVNKHTWVYYHSFRFRERVDCEKREPLWADFGLTNKLENTDDQQRSDVEQ